MRTTLGIYVVYFTVDTNGGKMDTGIDDGPKPKCLHQTQSIFLRNLNPTITKQEVEALCRKYPGFIRVALQEPQPERRFARRGWVTFDRTVNVKDICFALNNIRVWSCLSLRGLNQFLQYTVRVKYLTGSKTIM